MVEGAKGVRGGWVKGGRGEAGHTCTSSHELQLCLRCFSSVRQPSQKWPSHNPHTTVQSEHTSRCRQPGEPEVSELFNRSRS